jgi:hypothetical protein
VGLLSMERVLAEEAAELVGPGTKLSAEDLQPALETQKSERARTHKRTRTRVTAKMRVPRRLSAARSFTAR